MDKNRTPVATVTMKPVPKPDAESAPFWDNARRHVLSVQRCRQCGTTRLPATTYCPSCQSPDSEWFASTGRGRVFSWIVVHHPIPKEAFACDVPYVVALITLDEGPRIVTNIVGCPPSTVAANMPVHVRFEERDGFSLPVFEPAF